MSSSSEDRDATDQTDVPLGRVTDDPDADAAFAKMLADGARETSGSVDRIRRKFYDGADVPQGDAFDQALKDFTDPDTPAGT